MICKTKAFDNFCLRVQAEYANCRCCTHQNKKKEEIQHKYDEALFTCEDTPSQNKANWLSDRVKKSLYPCIRQFSSEPKHVFCSLQMKRPSIQLLSIKKADK